MKLKKGFIVQEVGNEHICIDATGNNFSGLVRCNETVSFILEQLKKDTTEEKIVSAMLDEYDVDEERAKNDVADVIEKFRNIGAIE